jgi:ubiquinone/menaquinone biosynthesis C-methylase UbiE
VGKPLHTHLHDAVHRRGDTHFDQRQSHSYDRLARWTLRGLYRRVAQDVIDSAPTTGGVLDVGTGPGRLLHEVAVRRQDLVLAGADLSPDMITVAERAADSRGLAHRISFRVADVTALPYADDSFDLVVSTLSMHHWPAVGPAVAELARVLRPGGRVLIYDFRFTPMDEAIAALGTTAKLASGHVLRTPVRAGWSPVALFARLAVSTGRS